MVKIIAIIPIVMVIQLYVEMAQIRLNMVPKKALRKVVKDSQNICS